MQELTSVAAIIGFINGMKLFENPDKKSFIYFCLSILLGIIFGYFNFFGIKGIEQGLLVALASSGLYKITQKIGGL